MNIYMINSLLKLLNVIHKSLSKKLNKPRTERDIVNIFTRLIHRGKVKEAVNWLMTNDKIGILQPNEEI